MSLIAISACRGFGPVPPDLSARLDARALPSHGTGESTVEIDSKRFAGSFHALIAWMSDPPSARLQLWPDLGDKVFDCASSAHVWVAQSDRHTWEETERHPFRFIAMTILERATPLTSQRVLGARRTADATWELKVVPASGTGSLWILIDSDGQWQRRRYDFRGATWIEYPDRVEAHGFRMRILEEQVQTELPPPPAAFASLVP